MSCLSYARDRNGTAWAWISTAFCFVWDVVTTVVNAVLVTLESIFGWVLSTLLAVVELIEMIPIVGTIVRWALNSFTNAVFIATSLLDLFFGWIGIRPEKKLRVCTIILRDEHGTPVCTPAVAVSLLQTAVNLYERDANVRIVPLRPFHYATGFGNRETADNSWVQTDASNGDSDVLDIPCEAAGAGADWLLTGSKLQKRTTNQCFFGIWRRVIGYGAPVTCFIIRDVVNDTGCSLWVTDYVTVEGASVPPHPIPRIFAHECGHSCNLLHRCVDDDPRNLMGRWENCNPPSSTPPDVVNPRLTEWQALAIRTSKHVTYF